MASLGIIAAPQEAASCGQNKCKNCGIDIPGYYSVGPHGEGKRKRSFCSCNCQGAYRRRERRRNGEILESKENVYKQGVRHRAKWRDKIKAEKHKYYLKNKERLLAKTNARIANNRPKHTEYCLNWQRKNVGRNKENRSLYKAFGTARNVPLVCKKILSIRWSLNHGNLLKVFNQISEGKTYAAYL